MSSAPSTAGASTHENRKQMRVLIVIAFFFTGFSNKSIEDVHVIEHQEFGYIGGPARIIVGRR
jgi:hypothetical protein